MKQYRSLKDNTVVMEEDALDYVLDKLGIELIPTNDIEQEEFKEMIVEWYFSANWIKEECDEDIPNLEYELEMADREYQDKLDREWGLV